ncbi:hypothetical protein [Botrimarina hoheduenensis]|uniref:Uncharacterized protein n=1 Tax=Botrimarina hoheduenensis TaxID=2528000 RepID=A0A5C5W7P3_9BACT|nr:hypothetical protein [Botrimarina hoheduenensis]TWT46467.1 hypothetical protein Pla111_15630 [Botrimarina hoheduenensis]
MSPVQRLTAIGVALVGLSLATSAEAWHPYTWPSQRAQNYNWNANYAHVQYGQPVALVVPPTATLQTQWGWGVGSSRISRLDHQFGRNYPGPGPHGGPFQNTPAWPQDTVQFGAYHVRGPW